MKKIMIFAALALTLAACCGTSKQKENADAPKLVILHTNDTHSHLEPVRSGEDRGRGGAIERAAFVDSVRAAMGDSNVLLLHAGDFNQGSSYYTEFGGDIEVDVVNAMRYDCVTLGNHEFDNGIEDLCERVKRIDCPVVCANLDLSPFELGKYVKPCVTLEKGGMKVGIIGLEADITTNVSKTISSRIPQLDPVEVTNKYAAQLRGEGCDIVILLSHQGYDEDQKIAAASRGLDLVVGGHTHTDVDGFVEVDDLDGRKVRVITDGCWGKTMGEIKVY